MANYEEKKKQREKERAKAQKKQEKKAKTLGEGNSVWLMAPIIFLVSVVPLVVYGRVLDTRLDNFNWYMGEALQFDMFRYQKMIFIITACVVMALILLYQKFIAKKQLPWHKIFIPLGIYGVLVIISTILSSNSYFSLHGIHFMYEPVWLLVGYCLIVYYTYMVMCSVKNINIFLPWFLAGVAVMTILGVCQAIGHDPIHAEWFLKLLLPNGMDASALEFKEGESNLVYLTLANRDYVGGYIAITLPIVFACLLIFKKLWSKILMGVLLIAELSVLYMSGSKSGVLALPVIILLTIVLYRKEIKKHYIIAIGLSVVLIAGGAFLEMKSNHLLSTNIKNSLTLTQSEYALKSIETGKDKITVNYKGEKIYFQLEADILGGNSLVVTDQDNHPVAADYNEEIKSYVSTDERFPFQWGGAESDEGDFSGFHVTIDGKQWLFALWAEGDEEASYYAYEGGKYFKLKEDKTKYNAFLDKYPGIMSGRGFIWSRSLTMLKKHPIFGSGPDTYLLEYPNDDLVARYNAGFGAEYISKPHSWYLQIATQTGLPSLFALLVFFGWFIVSSVRTYWKADVSSQLTRIGIGVTGALVGFLMVGIANDSFISSNAMLFALLGLGCAVNHLIRKQMKEIVE